jgi:methyl-accepting chemotaxis protein
MEDPVGIESILLFIGLAVAVATIALYLIVVAAMLRDVSFTVGTVLVGVRSIALQTQPIGSVLRDIVRDVQTIDEALEGLLEQAEEAEAAREVRAG